MGQPALTTRFLSADFFTSSHYIFGQIKATNTGLMGILADPSTRFMEVYEASIARVQNVDQVINYNPMMCIVKPQIVAVCLSKREYVGPASMLRGGYTRITEYPVQITTPVYELRGTLEWSGRFEFSALMAEGTNAFIVLYNAIMLSALYPSLQIERPAMLFNRSYLDTMVVGKKTGEPG